MWFILVVLFILIAIFGLRIVNKNVPDSPLMILTTKIAFLIWGLTFLVFIFNLSDSSKLQLPSAIAFFVVSISVSLVLLGIQIFKFNKK